jgi:hypothetical protein
VKTPISAGAKALRANQDKFILVVLMTQYLPVTHVAIKSASYTKVHGTRARLAKSTIIVHQASKPETKQHKKKQVEPL